MPQPAAQPPPFRVLVLGRFGGEAAHSRTRLPADAQRLDEALATLEPRVTLELPGAAEPVELRFRRLADFHPAQLARAVPGAAELRELRELAAELQRGAIDLAAFRERARGRLSERRLEALARDRERGPARRDDEAGDEAPAAAGPAADEGSVDSILSMVDAGEGAEASEERRRARRAVDALTPEARRTGARGGAAAELVAELDAALAETLGALLGAPAFRALEARWRGLAWLAGRAGGEAPVALELLPCDPAEAPAALEALEEGEDADLLLLDDALDASARDLERAEALAEAAERLRTPLATAVAPEFLGLERWEGLARARDPRALFDGSAYDGWRSLRGRECARWLVLLANRFALRPAYGPEGASARGLPIREAPERGLFGSPVYALGAVAAGAFAGGGAGAPLSGPRHGLVADLALLPASAGARPAPVEGRAGTERLEDLARIGLVALGPYQDDAAAFGPVHTFRRPERYADAEASADALQQVTLAYQLLAGRLVRALGHALPELQGAGDADATARELRHRVCTLLSAPDRPLPADHVGVAAQPRDDDPGTADVTLRVQPERTLAGRPVNLLLRFPLSL